MTLRQIAFALARRAMVRSERLAEVRREIAEWQREIELAALRRGDGP